MQCFLEWLGPLEHCEELYAGDYISEHKAPDFGVLLHLTINAEQLDEIILMTDAAQWDIPELGVRQDSYAHAGYCGPVAGLLAKVATDVDMMRGGYPSEQQPAFDAFLARIGYLLAKNENQASGLAASCKLQIRDPSGLSFVAAKNEGEWVRKQPFDRSFRESDELGIVSEVYHAIEPSKQKKTTDEVAELVSRASRVACLSGAGISVESGIPPFRSDTGDSIWGSFSADRMTVQGFNTSEEVVKYWWDMKHSLLPKVNNAKPNAAHEFFGFLEGQGKLGTIVTQNIDSLHQKGGVSNKNVIEMHGHMRGLICSDNSDSIFNPLPYREGTCTYRMAEGEALDREYCADTPKPRCPLCDAPLRTETVMFNQPLPSGSFSAAVEAVSSSDLLFVVGTSLIVEPANSLPSVALRLGIPLVMVNLDDTQYDEYATALIRKPAGEFFSAVQEKLALLSPPGGANLASAISGVGTSNKSPVDELAPVVVAGDDNSTVPNHS